MTAANPDSKPDMTDQHDFAQILRIVGRGPKLSRALTRAEACAATLDIIDGRVTDTQLGALLLLLRYRRETAEEIAGMIDAFAAYRPPAMNHLPVDLDWPSYADRHRQQPWYILSALLLAQAGARVLMHGLRGASDGYAPVRPVLDLLDVPQADMPDDLPNLFVHHNLVYIGVEKFAPALERLFGLRPMLGVRTVANTLARALNPADAPVQLQGVFHPNYRALHAEVARLRRQPVAAIIKGGGGEIQRNPHKPCRIAWVRDDTVSTEDWPAVQPNRLFDWRAEDLSPQRIVDLWRGTIDHPAAVDAIVGTAAIGLQALGRATDPQAAQLQAYALWCDRLVRPPRALGAASDESIASSGA